MDAKEMAQAMLDGKTLVNKKQKAHAFFNPLEYSPFRLSWDEGDNVPLNGMWSVYGWEIDEPREPRPMIRDEVLGFLAHTEGIVVRLKPDCDWMLPAIWNFSRPVEDYEWTTISKDGVYGEPRKFLHEEE